MADSTLPAANQFFGLGRQPLAQYFRDPDAQPGEDANNPYFSPQAQQFFRQDDAALQAQAQQNRALLEQQRAWMNADQAHDISDQAPNMSYDQMQQVMTPEMLARPGFEPYFRNQQREERMKLVNQSLGPSFAAKIKDPTLGAAFNSDLQNGVDFHQAVANHRTREFNQGVETQFAHNLVPEEARKSALRQDGSYDPVAAARLIAQFKHDPNKAQKIPIEAANKYFGMLLGDSDKGISPNPDAARWYLNTLEELGYNIDKFKQGQAAAQVQQGNADGSPQGNPPPSVSPATQVTPPVDHRTVEEIEAAETPNEEEHAIGTAWTGAKQKLINPFVIAHDHRPDKALAAARDVYNGRMVDTPPDERDSDGSGRTLYSDIVLKKMGIDPNAVAFNEPGNKRWGSQAVTNREVMRELAKDYYENHHNIHAPVAASPVSQAAEPIKPGEAIKTPIGTITRVK